MIRCNRQNSGGKVLVLFYTLILLAGLVGCGYHFKGMGLQAPEGVQTIIIPMMENKTTRPGIETFFTGDLTYEFTRSKILQVVKKETADSVLSGTIVSLKTETVTQTADFQSDERRATITLSLVFKRKDGKVLWANKALSDNEIYTVSDDRSTTDQNEREAIETISERMADKIHNRILEDF